MSEEINPIEYLKKNRGTPLSLRDFFLLFFLLILVFSLSFMLGSKTTIKQIEKNMIDNPLFCMQIQSELYKRNLTQNNYGDMFIGNLNTSYAKDDLG